MKVTYRVNHGKTTAGRFKKECENCQEEYMAGSQIQRFCDAGCCLSFRYSTGFINKRRFHHYKLSEHDFVLLLAKQNEVCAICKCPETRTRSNRKIQLAIDHSHDSGLIRGLLCTDCNRGLGMFHDDVHRLESAARYIMESSCV